MEKPKDDRLGVFLSYPRSNKAGAGAGDFGAALMLAIALVTKNTNKLFGFPISNAGDSDGVFARRSSRTADPISQASQAISTPAPKATPINACDNAIPKMLSDGDDCFCCACPIKQNYSIGVKTRLILHKILYDFLKQRY